MKRISILFIAALLLICTAAQAQPLQENGCVPQDAQYVRTEMDDGMQVDVFRTEDGTHWEVTSRDNTVLHVEMKSASRRGGASAKLTDAEAAAVAQAQYPDAAVHFVTQERDDGRFVYHVHFSTPEFTGHMELNAENGEVLELDRYYVRTNAQIGPITADEARQLVLALTAGGRITDFESERDEGRAVYEGEAVAGGYEYEFVIDAQTGLLTEWTVEKH